CVGIRRRISEAPPVAAVHAVTQRGGDDVAVLFGEWRKRFVVAIKERVLGSTETMERDDQRIGARAVVRLRHVHVVRDDLACGVEQVVPLEVAGLRGKRVLASARGSRYSLSLRKILVGIERAQFEPGAVYVSHPVDGEENLGAQVFGRAPGIRFETGN